MKRCLVMLGVIGAAIGPAADVSAQVYLSNRCATPYFWCFIPQVAPVGTPCFCASPQGAVNGVVS